MIVVVTLSPALDVTYLVDSVLRGGIHRPREVIRLPGGKGLNFARAARRLGAEVRVVLPLGGAVGTLIDSLARRAGIDTVVVPIGGDARSCVTVAADDEPGLTEFYESAVPLTVRELDAVHATAAALPAGGWTVFTGSVPAGTDRRRLIELLRLRTQAGDRIAVDTHGDALDAIVTGMHPNLIKVNRAEACELLAAPASADAGDLAASIHRATGAAAVVTDGADGAAAADSDGAWRVLPHPQSGLYPVGSGDAFFAGLVVALGNGDDLPGSLTAATAAGVANAAHPGAGEFGADTAARARDLVTVLPA